jgi:hypothetical protein
MYQSHSNPTIGALLVKERHKDYLRENETARRLALASGLPRRNWTLLGRTRHLLGATLIHAGTWLQGARLPDLSSSEAPPSATPSLP